MKRHPWGWIPSRLGRVAVLCLGFLCVTGPEAAGQEQKQPPAPPGTTLKVSVDIVNIYAVVRGKKGRLIDLGKEDFQVTEDDVPQEIRYFARQTDTPLTLGLLIDTSPSQQRVLGIEKEEGKRFIGQVLRPKDLAFVLHFDLEVELLQDFTSSASLLSRGLDEAVINGGGQGPMPGTFPGSAALCCTDLYDAVYLASSQLLKNEIGRKVLILLTDGEDQGSKTKLNEALEAVQKADVIVYSINVSDRGFYSGQGVGYSGDSVLRKLSEETGGHVVEVKRQKDMAAAFEEIADELRTQYALGYSPTKTKHDGSFRKIRVRTRQGDYKVQARRGYYAPTE
jgi:VWFA-related protein